MEWLLDPTAWAGLVTLILLELVLGIDNLIFIAILVEKLPGKQRDLARKLGLVLALGMRIVLLATVSWLASLNQPWLNVFGREFSARDCILVGGGLFLLYKATTEVHGRIEGHSRRPGAYKAQFWMVVIQIVVLDAVFSLDAVIMAIGMTDYLMVMILAVTIAIMIMISVSKALTAFVNRHQTVVILCLGFLLMVGLSLVLDGMGFHIPKGYLYAAIAFSIMIETINQFAQARMKKRVTTTDMRERTADAILKLMGAKPLEGAEEAREANLVLQEAAETNVISDSEKHMLRGVLNLSQRPVSTIMTQRREIVWVDLLQQPADLLKAVQEAERSRLLAAEGDLDNIVGILRKDELLAKWMGGADRQVIDNLVEEPLYVREDTTVMALLEFLKKYPAGIAIVTEEGGAVAGVVTHIDLLEAIAGEFPSQDQPYEPLSIHESANGEILIDGMASIYDVANKLGVDFKSNGHYSTIAGYVLHALGRMPAKGDTLKWQGWMLEIKQMDGRRISRIRARAIPKDAET
ncbi:MAG TPA: transporter associated domain-containing protein [Patescibacteria group bacterium]|nr:transporter associated domain-containing protein [Patescibacteria group bacterium]